MLTLNLWHDRPPGRERGRAQREWLDALRPDVVALQEVLRGTDACQARELLEGLGYQVLFGPVVPFWDDSRLLYGNAIATRLPVRDSLNLALPRGGSRERRAALFAELVGPDGPLCVACTHLHHRTSELRTLQMGALLDAFGRFRADRPGPALILGDLNASPHTPEVRLAADAYGDAFASCGSGPGLTWSVENPYAKVSEPPGVRIDYVLYSRDPALRPVHCRRVCDRPSGGVWPSDHFGVYAELTSEPPCTRRR